MAQAPYMPVFTDALLGDTSHLNSEQFGSYCRILFATWRNNGVPFADDDKTFACICHMTVKRWRDRIRDTLAAFFDLSDGRWRQRRLEKEWEYVANKRGQRRSAGNASAQARRLRNNNTGSTHVGTHGVTTQLHTQEGSLEPSGSKGADAPPTHPPPMQISEPERDAPDPPERDRVTEIWDRGVRLLGKSSRSLIGKCRRDYGDLAVMEALLATEDEGASHPVEFFVGCLRQRGLHARGQHRSTPLANWVAAAPIAVARFLARQRDSGIDDAPDDPLLDSRRDGDSPRIAARGLA